MPFIIKYEAPRRAPPPEGNARQRRAKPFVEVLTGRERRFRARFVSYRIRLYSVFRLYPSIQQALTLYRLKTGRPGCTIDLPVPCAGTFLTVDRCERPLSPSVIRCWNTIDQHNVRNETVHTGTGTGTGTTGTALSKSKKHVEIARRPSCVASRLDCAADCDWRDRRINSPAKISRPRGVGGDSTWRWRSTPARTVFIHSFPSVPFRSVLLMHRITIPSTNYDLQLRTDYDTVQLVLLHTWSSMVHRPTTGLCTG